MPVRQLRPAKHPAHDSLVQRLAAEWARPAAGATEPVILEEFDNSGDLAHVYVVWSEFQPIDQAERSEVVMEAADQRHGRTNTAAVTLAIGLTPAEADATNLAWR